MEDKFRLSLSLLCVIFASTCLFLTWRLNEDDTVILIQKQTIELQKQQIGYLEWEIENRWKLLPATPDRDQVSYLLSQLYYGLSAHEFYVLNPNWVDDKSGSVEFNQRWVNNYQILINWLSAIK